MRSEEVSVSGEPIRGLVYGYLEKAYQKKKSWYCGSSSSSFDGGYRETISAMESKIAYLNAELAAVAERENKERRRERRRLRQQRSSDGCDQQGDENDKSDKESEGDENGKSDKESEGDEE
ncbi:hypothetical protein H5410_022795 [Solanum commersonii]|uniref:Uncharacterized protein n=1 Tax=Solanum commersonii TaxID=4109 RepID=A0A9J5ZFR2_SOLCO|nr:hypothetical protein H5410_022795 [Solanum commersonii]